ncbi:MAG: DUF3575 domain-containing protein [Paludibacter sp.]|jgi:outer membrane protein OmpA-like peptidoglycan-associated protein|nr:DUF3575 domain-containing protein [Paludibacter sp.]
MSGKRCISVLFFALCFTAIASAQENEYEYTFGLSTNLLYDATATANLGGEWRLSPKFSFLLPVNYNNWTFPYTLPDNYKIKHWLVQPELRYWLRQPFSGAFWGLHAHGAQFNILLPKLPRYQGWLAGAGISYGYMWNLSRHWALEATIGAGYAYIDFGKYACQTCGGETETGAYNYFGITKAGLSLVYLFGKNKQSSGALAQTELAPANTIPKQENMPQPENIKSETLNPETKSVKYLNLSGKAFITFPVNKSTLLPDFEQNPVELALIRLSVDSVQNIKDAVIKNIIIEAYASPEGNLTSNIALSERRAAALRDYIVQTYGLNETDFTVRSKGENWEGLRSALETSNLTERQRTDIAKIIDLQDVSTRKLLLKQYENGAPYQYLLKEIYPKLRISEYTINYELKIEK